MGLIHGDVTEVHKVLTALTLTLSHDLFKNRPHYITVDKGVGG